LYGKFKGLDMREREREAPIINRARGSAMLAISPRTGGIPWADPS